MRRLQCHVQHLHALHHRGCTSIAVYTVAHMLSGHHYKPCSKSNLKRRMTVDMNRGYKDNNDLAGKEVGIFTKRKQKLFDCLA